MEPMAKPDKPDTDPMEGFVLLILVGLHIFIGYALVERLGWRDGLASVFAFYLFVRAHGRR